MLLNSWKWPIKMRLITTFFCCVCIRREYIGLHWLLRASKLHILFCTWQSTGFWCHMERVCSSETSVFIYKYIRHHKPDIFTAARPSHFTQVMFVRYFSYPFITGYCGRNRCGQMVHDLRDTRKLSETCYRPGWCAVKSNEHRNRTRALPIEQRQFSLRYWH